MRKVLLIGASLVAFISQSSFAECPRSEAEGAVKKVCERLTKNKERGLKYTDKFRYCGGNYVWIQEKDSVNMVLHPIKKQLNGKPLKDFKDKKGKHIFVEFDKAAPAGGWVDYVWPKPNKKEAEPKISYVKQCDKTNLVAGSGIWTTDEKKAH